MINLFWRLVFWFKHRGGFLDLGMDIAVTGVVTSVVSSDDGDFVFNVRLDPDSEWANVTFGRRKTSEPGAEPDTLHCEVSPWAPIDVTAVVVGARVTVAGRWGYDGVHANRGQLWDIMRCVFGASPALDGWCEIHPVTSVHAS